ncbi:AI-2E family transporter [Candidatus Kaiserbacteria bacterium]|nr:AI-2E family transporter [Candidatus Kaiserbacteria bacterium]
MKADQHTTISITTGTVLKTLLLIILVALLFFLRDIVLDVLVAIVISSAIEPPVKTLRRAGIPRVLSIALMYVALLVGFFAIFYFFLPLLFEDIAAFVSAIPSYLEAINSSGVLDHYTEIFGISTVPITSTAGVFESFQSFMSTTFLGQSFSSVGGIFSGVFSFVIIFVFSFYFAVIETGVDDFLEIIMPKAYKRYALGLWKRVQHKIGLWMQGQILLALIMGVLVFLGLTILGVPNAFLLAVLAAVFEIIPVFGPALAALPAIAIAFTAGGLTLGLLTIALYVIAQQFENHLIYPLVVTRVVGVPPLLVILALIIGAQLAGFLGIILSVPIAASIQEFIRDLKANRIRAEYMADA